MGLIVASGSNTPPVEAGTCMAIGVGYVDLGTQVSEYGEKRRVLIMWELPDQRIEREDGNYPRWVSQRYTLTLSEKGNLRPMLESWRGREFTAEELKGFDLDNIVAANCMLNIVHVPKKKGGGVRAEVKGVMPLPKGMPKRPLESKPLCYKIQDDLGNFVEPPEFPLDWITDAVKESLEYKAAHGIGNGTPPPAGSVNSTKDVSDDDPIPF